MLAKVIVRGATREQAHREPGARAGELAHRRHRDQPAPTCASILATPDVRRRRADDGAARAVTRCACRASRCWRPARRPPCRTGRAGRAVGRRRAAVGTDGRARVPPREPHGRQRRRRGRARDDGHRRDAALRRRRGDRARRRRHGCRRSMASPCRSGSRSRCSAGSVLALGAIRGAGQRAYLAVRGGFDVPEYLGSRSTFTLGQFGGHGGRALRTGDVLRLRRTSRRRSARLPRRSPRSERPDYAHAWRIGVIDGPHGAPDFFTADDIAHVLRDRLGSALQLEPHRRAADRPEAARGRAPTAARRGCIRPTSTTTPTPSAASTSPATCRSSSAPTARASAASSARSTIVDAELWKIGQLRPGDTRALRARRDAGRAAARAEQSRRSLLDACRAIARNARATICVRRAGESNLLVEFGAPVLDLVLRFQVQALLEQLNARRAAAVIDLTPGIRSLQIHFDPRAARRRARCSTGCWPRSKSCRASTTCACRAASCTCRCRGTIRPRSSRSSATSSRCAPTRPGVPTTSSSSGASTGSTSREDVRDIVFGASYLVMGLGDVYLGAPVATPLDPRHRLVTTKYNPARTWTPENAVGIGGAYLCVYGMEGPGGYQFVGRTVQMWNRYRQTARLPRRQAVAAAVLRPDPLLPGERGRAARACATDFPYGRHPLRIEESHLDLRRVPRASSSEERDSIDAFRRRQRDAFDASASAGASRASPRRPSSKRAPKPIAARAARRLHRRHVAGVRQRVADQGRRRPGRSQKGDTLVVMEAMKMEIAVLAEAAGTVVSIHQKAGAGASAGDTLLRCVRTGARMNTPLSTYPSAPSRARIAAGDAHAARAGRVAHRAAARIPLAQHLDPRGRRRVRCARGRAQLAAIATRIAAAVRHSVRHQGQHRSRGRADHRRRARPSPIYPAHPRRWCRR